MFFVLANFRRAAARATGHSFYYLKGAAAMLELGLIQYAMKKAITKVYHAVIWKHFLSY